MPTSSYLLHLLDCVLQQLVLFLEAPELLQLLCCNRQLHRLGTEPAFWEALLRGNDDKGSFQSSIARANQRSNGEAYRNADGTEDAPPDLAPRRQYLVAAYCRHLPAARWRALRAVPGQPTAREGHLACLLSAGGAAGAIGDERDLLVVTGGFVDDRSVHVRHLVDPQAGWRGLRADGASTVHAVYGATLTPISGTAAIRLGGFRSGGYSNESGQVALLTVDNANGAATWRTQETSCSCNVHPASVARAYHTANLLLGRYLLVMGGMTARESVLDPLLLDTRTWRWYPVLCSGAQQPSGRHGHSTIYDPRNRRFVIFGGGSGSDLLRSGKDNAQVWELKLPDGWESNIVTSMPWVWRLVHDEPANPLQHEDDGTGMMQYSSNRSSLLQPAETLILGRCHVSHRVSLKTVLLAFGSGRPSTNGLIAYDLSSDSFKRPRVYGKLPPARLSAASVFMETQGYIIVHGGYSTQSGTTVADIDMLDLAPALSRRPLSFQICERIQNHAALVDDDALAERNIDHHHDMEEMIHQFWNREDVTTRLRVILSARGMRFRSTAQEDPDDTF